MVSVQFLGSGDAFGSGGRLQACILLTGGDSPLLLDCGTTSLVALKRATIDPGSIGHVAVSHLHGDHYGGLPFLILDGQFNRRVMPLLVAGPVGIEERTLAAMEVFYPGSTQVQRRFEVRFTELEPGATFGLGHTSIDAFEADHSSGAPSLCLRLRYGGKTIAYSGDTAWTESLIQAANGSDLFICESYSFDKPVRFHMDYATLRRELPRIGAKRTVLTHMSCSMLDRLDEIDVETAFDGAVFEVGQGERQTPLD